MIKYKFDKQKPNKSQSNEVEEFLLDPEFIKILKLSNSYYIQGYYGDYGFVGEQRNGDYYITVTIY